MGLVRKRASIGNDRIYLIGEKIADRLRCDHDPFGHSFYPPQKLLSVQIGLHRRLGGLWCPNSGFCGLSWAAAFIKRKGA